jgi:excisionase family DNA binding protein
VTTLSVEHELMTVSETAELLRVSEATIRRRIAVGEIPALRVGAQVRVEREGLSQLRVRPKGRLRA